MKHSKVLLATLIVVGCSQGIVTGGGGIGGGAIPDSGPPPPPIPGVSRVFEDAACDDDATVFFVDYVEGPVPGAQFKDALANHLGPALSRADVVAGPRHVSVDPVLAQRAEPANRADGHRRFFRVRVYEEPPGGAAPNPKKLLMSDQCTAVEEIRLAVRALQPKTRFRVGREWCAMAPASKTSFAPDTALGRWHLTRVGALPHPALDQLQPQTVFVLDADVRLAGQAPGFTRVKEADFGKLGDQPCVMCLRPRVSKSFAGPHPHGSAMAALTRQVTGPMRPVTVVPVLQPSGHGTDARLAQALDYVLFDAPRGGGRVVNMSVGWPPELSHDRIAKGICSGGDFADDAIGGAVKYLLALAAGLDSRQDPLVIVGAVGNRTFHETALFEPLFGTMRDDTSREFFYPAQWMTDPNRPAQIAVGAVNTQDGQAALSRSDIEPPLVAPGEHVTAWGGAHTVGLQNPADVTQEMPAQTVSGTSVATALVSGAAARILANPNRPRSSGADVIGLLSASAIEMGRSARTGEAVRRLSVERAEHALLECGACMSSGDCSCLPPARPLHPARPRPQRPVTWPQTSEAPSVCCADKTGCSCSHDEYTRPRAERLTRAEFGSLGPQPTDPACPVCWGEWAGQQDRILVHLNWNTKWPAVLDAKLLVHTQSASYAINLAHSAWKTKAYVKVQLPLPAGVAYSGVTKAHLVVTAKTNGDTFDDYSPIPLSPLP